MCVLDSNSLQHWLCTAEKERKKERERARKRERVGLPVSKISTGKLKGKGFLNAIVCDPISPNGLNICTWGMRLGSKPAPLTSYTNSPNNGFEMITVDSASSVRLDGRNVNSNDDCSYGPWIGDEELKEWHKVSVIISYSVSFCFCFFCFMACNEEEE